MHTKSGRYTADAQSGKSHGFCSNGLYILARWMMRPLAIPKSDRSQDTASCPAAHKRIPHKVAGVIASVAASVSYT